MWSLLNSVDMLMMLRRKILKTRERQKMVSNMYWKLKGQSLMIVSMGMFMQGRQLGSSDSKKLKQLKEKPTVQTMELLKSKRKQMKRKGKITYLWKMVKLLKEICTKVYLRKSSKFEGNKIEKVDKFGIEASCSLKFHTHIRKTTGSYICAME